MIVLPRKDEASKGSKYILLLYSIYKNTELQLAFFNSISKGQNGIFFHQNSKLFLDFFTDSPTY